MTYITEDLIHDINSEFEAKSIVEYDNLFDGDTSVEEYLIGLYEDILELQEAMGMYYNIATSLYYKDIDE